MSTDNRNTILTIANAALLGVCATLRAMGVDTNKPL